MGSIDYNPTIESDHFEEGSKSFRDMIVWQKAHQFVLDVYQISSNFPKQEQYGITSQLRRSACSVPANIVEGFNRYSKAEKLRFYNIALASLREAEYFLILVHDLGYADSGILINKIIDVGKILNTYMYKIRK